MTVCNQKKKEKKSQAGNGEHTTTWFRRCPVPVGSWIGGCRRAGEEILHVWRFGGSQTRWSWNHLRHPWRTASAKGLFVITFFLIIRIALYSSYLFTQNMFTCRCRHHILATHCSIESYVIDIIINRKSVKIYSIWGLSRAKSHQRRTICDRYFVFFKIWKGFFVGLGSCLSNWYCILISIPHSHLTVKSTDFFLCEIGISIKYKDLILVKTFC